MGIFRTKNPEDEAIERIADNGGSVKKKATEKVSSKSVNLRVERMDARMDALKEVMDAQREQFERVSEEIGELRRMIADHEKQMQDVEMKSVKAYDMVFEVHPERMSSEQKKMEAKIDALRAKMESGESISDNIIEELKKIKNKMAVFGGTEEIRKLNQEVVDELASIRKVEAKIEKHADRVDAIYNNFQSSVEESEKTKKAVDDMSDAISELRKGVEKNSVGLKDIPSRKEFMKERDANRGVLEDILKEKEVYLKRNDDFSKCIQDIDKRLGSVEARGGKDDVLDDIKDIRETLDSIRKRLDSYDKDMLEVVGCVHGSVLSVTSEIVRLKDVLNN